MFIKTSVRCAAHLIKHSSVIAKFLWHDCNLVTDIKQKLLLNMHP